MHLLKEKVHCLKVSLENNFYQKEKESSQDDPSKFNFAKFKAKNNMPNLLIKKDNITKIWKSSENSSIVKPKKYADKTKESAALPSELDFTPKMSWICYSLICQA
jgi:hypothetical protein